MTPIQAALLILVAWCICLSWLAIAWCDQARRLKRERDELRTTLRLFRDFQGFYVTQMKLGGSHQHPIWTRVAEQLGNQNHVGLTGEEYRYITGPFYRHIRPGIYYDTNGNPTP